jgi:Crp-like helix-turn-helix domain
MIGVNREVVTRAMIGLLQQGAVEMMGRRIHLRDHEALEREAEARPEARYSEVNGDTSKDALPLV